MRNKVLVAVFVFAVVLLGIDGIYYFSPKNNSFLSNVTSLFPINNKKNSIFELNSSSTNKPLLVQIQYSSLDGMTKAQAERLANTNGITSININNPQLDEPTKKEFEELSKTKYIPGSMISTRVLAGKFKGWPEETIIIINNNKEYKINFSESSRLLINTNNKLQAVSMYLPVLANTGDLLKYVKPNDLVMAVYVSQVNSKIEARHLIVFK